MIGLQLESWKKSMYPWGKSWQGLKSIPRFPHPWIREEGTFPTVKWSRLWVSNAEDTCLILVRKQTPHAMWCSQINQFSSVQSVMSDCLQPHGLQHARPPCPSPTPRIYSNSYPLSQWCHLTISSSAIPFSRLPNN